MKLHWRQYKSQRTIRNVSCIFLFNMANLHRHTSASSTQWVVDIDQRCKKELDFFQHRYRSHARQFWNTVRWNPDRIVPRRVFCLKGKQYHNVWEYKQDIAEGTFRAFYQLIPSEHRVLVYYVGSKPNKVPLPPP